MPLPFSRQKVHELGRRLRHSGMFPEQEDLAALEQLLVAHSEPLLEVAERLRTIGLAPTSRLKTSDTIIEKLRRESTMSLKTMHDMAGARVVRRMTLTQQDDLVNAIRRVLPVDDIVDRRAKPNHGYRAVHVIALLDGCYVEVQVRTRWQDLWAQYVERLGDSWGRAIRYGGLPNDPDIPAVSTRPQTRREFVELITTSLSRYIAEAEELEVRYDHLRWIRDEADDEEEWLDIRDEATTIGDELAGRRELLNGLLEILSEGKQPADE